MRLYTYLFIHLIFSITINAQKVKKTPLPNWVTPIIYQEEKEPNNEGAYKYLVLDYQDNLVQKEQFIHYAVKILNNKGIQEMSDINAVFDPAYQTIAFHKIQVFRNGEKIDKLQNATINTFQRETNLERSLYDGSLTAVINLSDIRRWASIRRAAPFRLTSSCTRSRSVQSFPVGTTRAGTSCAFSSPGRISSRGHVIHELDPHAWLLLRHRRTRRTGDRQPAGRWRRLVLRQRED